MAPEPPLALNVTAAVVVPVDVGGGVVETGAVGVMIFEGAEYVLLPNLLMAATAKR
jgi:hypothetical protein